MFDVKGGFASKIRPDAIGPCDGHETRRAFDTNVEVRFIISKAKLDRAGSTQGAFNKTGIVAADVQSALICVPSEKMRRLHVGGYDS
jgi:hypothetical protein